MINVISINYQYIFAVKSHNTNEAKASDDITTQTV